MFVTLEGIEGSGKSTLLLGMAQRLHAAGRAVTTAREPGGTPIGDAIRAVFLELDLTIAPLTEALLLNASRATLVADVIRPALARGDIVLCDRFTDSTLAYQGYGRGIGIASLREICAVATQGLLPDLTLVLDIPVDVSSARLQGRAAATDRMERETNAFYQRVREGFLELAIGESRMRVLDGAQTPETVLEAAMAEFERTAAV
jgi:dTMP kinase